VNEFTATAGLLIVLMFGLSYRLIRGPRVYNRLLAAGAIGTFAIVLLAVMGYLFERPDMFVDLALTYALLNFIGTVAVAKYLENHPEEHEPGQPGEPPEGIAG
jgi:multicomponent Na+:H+ antiporter subunit F